jgi:hypothetical protein
VIDVNTLKEIFIEQLDEGAASDVNNTSTTTQPTTGTAANTNTADAKIIEPPPKGRPYIVHMRVE